MNSGFYVTYKAFVPSGLDADEMAAAAQKIKSQARVLETEGFQKLEVSSRFQQRSSKTDPAPGASPAAGSSDTEQEPSAPPSAPSAEAAE